jgi:hypothetical protein
MQRLGAKALVWSALALIAAGAVGGTGCTAKKPTELVPGVSTQMVVPKDIAGVSIEVIADGRQVFCQAYTVEQATHIVDLPSTLGVIPAQSPDTVVKITIRGYDAPGILLSDFANCGGAAVGSSDMGDAPRILRRSIQTYVDQHTLFLPMPLSYSCIDKDCSTGTGVDYSCRGNVCVDSTTDQTTLPDFDPTLLDGTGLCFSPKECFPQGITFPAATIDANSCIYTLPSYANTASISSGVNVKVFYEDWTWQQNTAVKGSPYEQVVKNAGEDEILNEDPPSCGVPVAAGQKPNPPCEGFRVLPPESDAGAPETSAIEAQASLPTDSGIEASLPYNPAALRIQLAQGLCDLVHAGQNPPAPPAAPMTSTYHTISDISISGVCQPKLPLLPICATEINNNPVLPDSGTTGDGVCNVGVPLSPAPSLLYLVMDDTSVMHGALGPGGSVTELAFSFTDPVFKRTYGGFKYMTYNDQGNSCTSATTAYTTPDEPPCAPGTTTTCAFNTINSLQTEVATALGGWSPPTTENVLAPDGGTIVCYADNDCLTAGTGTYCAKPNPVLPEGGLSLDAGLGSEDAGDDGGDAGLTPGVCTNPQALDLAGAMRFDVGAYAQVSQFSLGLATPGVAGVMFFVNRAPETALGIASASLDGGVAEAGTTVDGGSGLPAYPSPIGALDCPALPPNAGMSAGTPGDLATAPAEAVAEQQILESEALNAFNNPGLSMQTFFVVLDNDRHDKTALNYFNQIQADLVQPNGVQPVITLDATDVSQTAIQMEGANGPAVSEAKNFSSFITKLGTCLYEIPQIQSEMLTSTTPTSSVKISYTRPLPPGTPPAPPGSNPPVVIPADGTCNQAAALAAGDAGGGPNGWNFDNNRIRICGAACDNLRTVINDASQIAIALGTPVPDVPVTITPLCSGTSGTGGSSDATTAGD